MRIIMAGGGTAGSVVPLVAIAEELKKQQLKTRILFIGTRRGEPEKRIVAKHDFEYASICGGKIRRYFDLRNVSDIILIIIGFFQSLTTIIAFKPDVVVGAGGYISVPVLWAAWLLRKKILIHQQDIMPSLSNILTKNLADRITVTFEKSLQTFPASKTAWTGNPVRSDILQGDVQRAYTTFHLKSNVPIVLVMGGGTGAANLNKLINQGLPTLVSVCQVVHLTGRGKRVAGIQSENYQQYEFLTDGLNDLVAAADLIVSRAGLSALTEFSLLKKPVILVPLPHSPQEENARYVAEKNAAVVRQEHLLSPTLLVKTIKELLADKRGRALLSENIAKIVKPSATQTIVREIYSLIKK